MLITTIIVDVLDRLLKIEMSTPPSRSLSETFLEAAAMRAATPTSDQPNLPLLLKYNEGHNEMMAHLDENNENDAVRKSCSLI